MHRRNRSPKDGNLTHRLTPLVEIPQGYSSRPGENSVSVVKVWSEFIVDAERSSHDVAPRVRGYLVGVDLTAVDELLHHAVIVVICSNTPRCRR